MQIFNQLHKTVDQEMSLMDEGTMIWYEGSGIYQDGIKIADIEINEMMDLLTQQGYTIIRDSAFPVEDGIKNES